MVNYGPAGAEVVGMKNTRQRLAYSGKHGCSMGTGTGGGPGVMTRNADTSPRWRWIRNVNPAQPRIDDRRAFKVD